MVKKCVCGKYPDVYTIEEGFQVSCPRCGKESKVKPAPSMAIRDWNRKMNKPIQFIVDREEVILGT